MSKIEIINAQPEHLNQIMRIEVECNKKGYIFPKRSMNYLLNFSKGIFLVAIDEKEVCGYLSVLTKKNSKIARVYNIVVSQDYRGNGLGKLLLKELISRIKSNSLDINQITAEVKTDNLASLKMFKSIGFTKIGNLLDYYGAGIDAVKLGIAL